jgi:hypothetical protein
MNSASPGGRAGKNAIEFLYDTSNTLHVKVLARINLTCFNNES